MSLQTSSLIKFHQQDHKSPLGKDLLCNVHHIKLNCFFNFFEWLLWHGLNITILLVCIVLAPLNRGGQVIYIYVCINVLFPSIQFRLLFFRRNTAAEVMVSSSLPSNLPTHSHCLVTGVCITYCMSSTLQLFFSPFTGTNYTTLAGKRAPGIHLV